MIFLQVENYINSFNFNSIFVFFYLVFYSVRELLIYNLACNDLNNFMQYQIRMYVVKLCIFLPTYLTVGQLVSYDTSMA